MKRREFSTLAALLAAATLAGPTQARGLAEYDLFGKYIYSHKHETGTDKFVYELKAGRVAEYHSTQEGEYAVDKTGTWSWDVAGNTITVTFPARKPVSEQDKESPYPLNKPQVFVFRIVGRDLKLIKEPKGRKGYVGFMGTVFKKA